MVSKGCPVSTKHTPPAPPAMKFFKADGGAFFLTGSSVLIILMSALFQIYRFLKKKNDKKAYKKGFRNICSNQIVIGLPN